MKNKDIMQILKCFGVYGVMSVFIIAYLGELTLSVTLSATIVTTIVIKYNQIYE